MMPRWTVSFFVGALLLGANQFCVAQGTSPRDELLALVPPDAGFCLGLQNLRGASEKWRTSPWLKTVRSSPIGKAFENAKEWQKLAELEKDLNKHFELTWPSLRDDILGDAIVLAYWPAVPGKPEQEKGLLLVRARRGDLLKKLVDRLNDGQTKSKDLKRLEDREYHGVKYQLREDKRSEHFLLVDGNLLVFAGKESLVKYAIDRLQARQNKPNVIAEQVNRAGAAGAFATLWINPRAFDAELDVRAQKAVGPEGALLGGFLTYWRPLDAVVLSVNAADDFEFRLAIQARVKDLPPSVQKAFTDPVRAAELWNRFPDGAILSMAGQIDLAQMAESVAAFMTADNRKAAAKSLQHSAGTFFGGLDLHRDVLPNVGPDWGMFVADAGQFPHVVGALAVKPGPGGKVDQGFVNVLSFFATAAALNNPADLKFKTVFQDNVEVKFLTGPRVFAPGVEPAWALKDGYLVLASSPDAVKLFRLHKNQAKFANNGEVPVMKLSTTELAKVLRARRTQVVDFLAEKNKIHPDAASRALESALNVMDLLDHVTFLQSSGNGQITWTIRVRPRNP